MIKKFLFCITAIIFSVCSAHSAEKMRIAVMDFQAKDISANDAAKITELIRNDMVNTGKFIMIERAQMGEVLKEQGLQQTGCTDISCAVEIGKILSVKKILVGTIMSLSGKIIITGRIVDVQNGVIEFSEKGVAESKDKVYAAVMEFTKNLAYRIGGGDNTDRKDSFFKNPYTMPSIGFSGISLLSIAGGYYFNMQLNSAGSDYDKYAATYKASTSPVEATNLHNKMTGLEKDADKYILYRNISYGIGATSLLVTGYYVYKVLTFNSPSSLSQNDNTGEIFPVFFNSQSRIFSYGNNDRYFLGGGILMRF